MFIIPAIDLLNGKVVRLTKGDLKQEKVYSDNPVAMAWQFQKTGAQLLHVVDLSAAFSQGDNYKIIEEIIKTVPIDVEVGGGIRSYERAKQLIDIGVKRIVIGTRALEREFLGKLIGSLGSERIAIGVDVKDSYVAVNGWQNVTTQKGEDVVYSLYNEGIRWIIYTDISRDGTLSGVNREVMKPFAALKDIKLIVSGGVSSLEDLALIKKELPFARGIIVGKAIYENKIDLQTAIKLL